MTRPSLPLQSLLDVLDDFRTQIPIAKCYLDVENASRDTKTRTLAKVAAEVMKKPEKESEFVDIINTNLRYVEPLSRDAKLALQRVLKLIEQWKFDTTGRVDNPPTLTDQSAPNFDSGDTKLIIGQEDMHRIQALWYINYPTKFHAPPTMFGIMGELLRPLTYEKVPWVVITVGP